MTGKNGWCVWITGLPGSGKSVISEALLQKLKEHGIEAQVLSSDALRKVITPNPTYSEKERDMVYDALALLAKHLTRNNINIIIDATGNLRRYRDNTRKQIPKFIEVYLECTLETCVQRETSRKNMHQAPTRIYEKGLSGTAPTVPGLGASYEPPLHPEITVNSEKLSPQKCAEKILATILEHFY